ncbi:glycerophosphodiester phosphodiesterase [Dorea sp. D27]|uniref:glycerophosphodiester phosphodiesterase n=1 Tax=Dorea sp. D27 TaxID=658665 RepID=UPI0006A06F06|nr:glycerophosphodiester phosphodiesterase [Dorea sp. D27]KMZ52823.1 glycerophosphoryl diester phosphodiesterase family protein [Dorea sp. D27]
MDMIPVILLLIPALYFFAVWPRTSRKEQMQRYEHTLFAHRGYHCASQGIPENSMSAFRAAISQGYGIELDVHLTLDGKLAVFHDDDLLRVCGSKDSIENLTYKELERYRLFDTKEHIPLFTDVLSLVNGQVPLLIEMKIPSSATDICSVLCETLKSYHGPYLVQSFNTMGLRWFRLHAPEVLRGQLSDNLTKKKSREPWLLRLMVRYLLTDFLGRPDFISYKLADLPNLSVSVLRSLAHTPVAVWTLRTEAALAEGIRCYDMQIFEKQNENY